MPNGGSDCCGTCWFNSKNDGTPGYHGAEKDGMVVCQIREHEIEDPFYTYCVNHPHHNPERLEVPIGPVYTGDDREVLFKAPHNEKVREALIHLLENIQEEPTDLYPAGISLDDQAITEVGKLGDKRASSALRRILTFNPESSPDQPKPFARDRFVTIGVAIEALARIEGNEALPDIERLATLGIETQKRILYLPKNDRYSVIRYHAIRGLKYTSGSKTVDLLKVGLKDPHKEIKAFSESILESKIGKSEMETKSPEQKPEPRKNGWWEFWKKNR